MITALLGSKIKQSQAFDDNGKRIPITLVSAGPNWITQISEQHVQLGFGVIKNLKKPQAGHLKKAGLEGKNLRFLRTISIHDQSAISDVSLGAEIKVEHVFAPGDIVRVTGTSKGKGFAGVVKRHGFRGGPRTHGQSDRERAPGSIGQTTTPGRVYKGKRMAGRMGSDTVTVRNLKVMNVDSVGQTLTILGLVPGAARGLLVISKE